MHLNDNWYWGAVMLRKDLLAEVKAAIVRSERTRILHTKASISPTKKGTLDIEKKGTL